MLDLSHIPNSQQDIQIFQANGSAWQTWQKPRKCNYVYIMCIGGAGGGSGGSSSSSVYIVNTAGASAGISRALYNAQQLADRLYVQVGLGGAGGTSGNFGSAGTRSLVALQPIINVAQNNVVISGAAGASGGNGPSGAAISGETASAQTIATFYTLSNFISTAGVSTISNPGLTPVDVNPLTSQITCPGAVGGSYNTSVPSVSNGASILSTAISPLIQGGLGSTTSNGTNGANGITLWKPFFSTGGAGGGASTVGIGGNGGNGGIGSGGGGAGNGFTQGGTGGKGGDGLVIIISF